MNAQRIEGAIALVTGANRGIGRALTEALLTRGVRKVYATAAIRRRCMPCVTSGSFRCGST